ncbi:MAG: winged helix-turn-helix transcriptional regulator [Desulfuromonadales bacterium]|nr:winged helix-turn-helix transcriptional regulator [Desulfuromonadales bacterium]MBN2791039.1 winged helix-turn-helix transcriptional regulator [Desulfuromonadales bacterium]
MTETIDNQWVTVLKALGHATRLQIVMELLKGTKCVTDIHDLLPVSQANISQHLTILRHAGLVDFTQKGAQRCYFLSRPELVEGILAPLKEEPPPLRKKAVACCLSTAVDAEN